MSQLNIANLSVAVRGTALSDISISLKKGQCLGLIGTNGAGKTSLLDAIAGRLDPTEGTIAKPRSWSIEYSDQTSHHEFYTLTMADYVLGLTEDDRGYNGWMAIALLEDLGVPERFYEETYGNLSWGLQAVARYARAMIGKPDLVLLDEPTNHLDVEHVMKIEAHLLSIRRNTCLVVASHDRAFLDACTTHTISARDRGQKLQPSLQRGSRIAGQGRLGNNGQKQKEPEGNRAT